ncbi:hypothetical protein CHS0354_005585 [Potamilus streckersoni]|uniref:Uncharacterized protein n=1 Tax=Potamilus streckersoni TaxID=2493646 RepID=A0AAE0RNF6_9BIVA|nr:hypothetical protein CHS0354_005585 [Potamilus streckersoni]
MTMELGNNLFTIIQKMIFTSHIHIYQGLILSTPMTSGNQISALPCEETTKLNGQEIGGDRNTPVTKPHSKLHESRSTVGDGSNFCKRELSKHLKLKKRPEVKDKAIQTFLTGEFIVKSGNIYTGDLVDTT